MRFLVDAQLPPALAVLLTEHGHPSRHVADVLSADAGDGAVWAYAESHASTIVTKDEDFSFRVQSTASGPSVVWIRLGNTSNRALKEWFAPLVPRIVESLARGERLVELI
jgi:predicted nuclease of predicted toxin-antitoxin system